MSGGRLLPAVLFGLRAAASGMLALYVAFSLRIDEPGWAGTSAVIVAQPILGASLRKGSFRLVGTLVGAVFSVLLYAAFPQERLGVLIGLAAWGAACSFVSTYLRDFSAYAAMLAGYTAAIICMEAVASPGSVFMLAVARGSAIAIGIVCTTVVFSVTDRGRQRQVLAEQIERLAAAARDGIRGLLGGELEAIDAQRDRRRALVAAVAGLDTVVDQAIGENYDLRSRVGVLRAALAGLFAALSGWRGVEQHLRRQAAGEAAVVRLLAAVGDARTSAELRDAAASLLAEPASTVSERVLLDQVAESLSGLAAAADGVTLLRDPLRAAPASGAKAVQVSDWLSAAVNAVRSFAIVGLAGAIWILSAWESGPTFVIFAMVVVMLYVLREESAFAGAAVMALGTTLSLLAAGVVTFALFPLVQGWGLDGYGTFVVVVGSVVGIAATMAAVLNAGSLAGGLAFAGMANFMPMLSPTNAEVYDYAGFLNGAIAILAGASLGAAGYRWLPPLSRGFRIERTLAGARRDLRSLRSGRLRLDDAGWLRRLYLRLVQMPREAGLQQHARVLAVMAIGRDLLRARRIEHGRVTSAADAMRLQAARLAIAEAVASHPDYLAGFRG